MPDTPIREDDTVLFKPKGRLRPGTVITACGTTLLIERNGERYIRHRRDVTLVPSSRKWCNLRTKQSPNSRVQRIPRRRTGRITFVTINRAFHRHDNIET